MNITPRTRLRRLSERARYDRDTLYGILDEGLLCHVGFIDRRDPADPHPVVIPTTYGRSGDHLYLHGSTGSRMMRTLAEGGDVCVTVTHLDGLVLARSLFHHSVNYRSAVVFGHAEPLTDREAKLAGLRVIVEHLVPGRWTESRPPTAKELAATLVLTVPLEEASVKVRSGPPSDDEDDYGLPIWAGVLPFELRPGPVQDDPVLPAGVERPPSVRDYRRG